MNSTQNNPIPACAPAAAERAFDFSARVNRFGTYSASWDHLRERYGEDFFALSVAEMDLATAPEVSAALEAAARRGIYSYTDVFPDFAQACQLWFSREHSWEIDVERIVFAPRIVQAFAALFAYHFRGQRVGTFTPFYMPVVSVIRASGAPVEFLALEANELLTQWTFDRQALAELFARIDVFVLTNPHNPTGRVWTCAELEYIAQLAAQHNVTVLSDDIHCDITFAGHDWTPFEQVVARLGLEVPVMTFVSPAKSFNIAGLEASAVVVNQPALVDVVRSALASAALLNPNYFALPGAIAAWTSDGSWFHAARSYICHNVQLIADHAREQLAGKVTVARPEGTYLLWVRLGDAEQPCRFGVEEQHRLAAATGVVLSPGEFYGEGWTNFARAAIALPRPRLELALERVSKYVERSSIGSGVEPR